MTKFVEIGGKPRPVKFGFWALGEFTEAHGIAMGDLGSISETLTIKQALHLVWLGLKNGARVEKTEFNTTLEELADWIDEDQDAMARVLDVFGHSFGGGEQNGEEVKK